MKKILFISFLVFSCIFGFSQENENKEIAKANYEFSFNLSFFQPLYANYDYYGYNSSQQVIVTSMLFSNGIRFTNRFYMGVSIGSEFISTQTIPLMSEIKYDFISNSLSPYFYANLGHSFALNLEKDVNNYYQTEWDGGLLGGWGFGVKKSFKNSTALSFNLGYRFQKISYKTNYNGDINYSYQETSYTINRIMVGSSFFFK